MSYIVILKVISDWNFFKELNCVKIFLKVYIHIVLNLSLVRKFYRFVSFFIVESNNY